MAVTWGTDLKFDQEFLRSFGERNHIQPQFVPNSRLAVYQQLLKEQSAEPDLMELDVVWPSVLADDLLDLRPYLNLNVSQFQRQILENYTVHGRLVALPIVVDVGVLYYRPELLERYGFHKPPDTWEELESMASTIQAGERRGGNKDFWGYIWQGAASEGGTCNALEWQASSGGGNFVEPTGKVNVRNSNFGSVLARAAGWIGTISPPAEYVYQEDDAVNLWDAGQTAFMRNWASGYGHLLKQPGGDRRPFAVAPMPAGPGGHRGTMGGIGIAISKYAANRELAIKAMLELTSEESDLARVYQTGGIPTHLSLLARPEVKERSMLLAVASQLIASPVSRPSLVAGEKYPEVSHEYSLAVNSVLRKKATPEEATTLLEQKLTSIMSLPVKSQERQTRP